MNTKNSMEAFDIAVSRRDFLKSTGSLTFAIALGAAGGLRLIEPAAAKRTQEISAWVSIAPDDRITIVTPAAEMGQGSMTGVPVALAEELDADWSKVSLEMAPAEPEIYGYNTSRGGRPGKLMGIFGSRAVMMYFDQMRIAGAQARKVLLMNAARHWQVPLEELETEPSVVVHRPTGRRMTYGEVAAFAELPATIPDVAATELKDPSTFRIIGTSVPRHDIPAKVNGTAQYSIDVQLPGMVYASTVHSPVQQGAPVRWNDAEVKALTGVIDIVTLESGVAVVAERMEQVLAARDALEVEWRGTAKGGRYGSERALEEDYPRIAEDPKAESEILERQGDDQAAFAGAARTFKRSYRSDYGYHAQMEPLNAVARFNPDGTLEVWEGTQAPGVSRNRIARSSALSR